MVSAHGIHGDPNALSQARSALTFVAFFLFLNNGDNELSFIKTATRAHTVRNVLRSALGAFGKPWKL